MEDTKAVVLDIDKQFFEITEGLVNFEVDFEVQTDNNAPFEIAIVDQQTLDSDEFPYKPVNEGRITGRVTNDNNRRTPFFMVLKAGVPTKAHVVLQKLSLPLVEDAPKTPIFRATAAAPPAKTLFTKNGISEKFGTFAGKNKNLLLFILAAAVVAFWWYKRKQKTAAPTPTPPQLAQSAASSPLSLVASPSNTNFGF